MHAPRVKPFSACQCISTRNVLSQTPQWIQLSISFACRESPLRDSTLDIEMQ